MVQSVSTPGDLERFEERLLARIDELVRATQSVQIVDAEELAKVLRASIATIERKTRDGSIPSFKVGDLRRYQLDVVLEALQKPRPAGEAKANKN